MLINLRNALMTSKKWSNPYPTNGLRRMMDGEWNAGPGRHSTNDSKWIDCVTGDYFDFSSYGAFSFGAKSLDVDYTNASRAPIQIEASDRLVDFTCVFAYKYNINRISAAFSVMQASDAGAVSTSLNVYMWPAGTYNARIDGYTSNLTFTSEDKGLHILMLRKNGSSGTKRIYVQSGTQASTTSSVGTFNKRGFAIATETSTDPSPTTGLRARSSQLNSFLVYDRAISDTEAQAIFKTHIERFLDTP